jgi:hypothetical protein
LSDSKDHWVVKAVRNCSKQIVPGEKNEEV